MMEEKGATPTGGGRDGRQAALMGKGPELVRRAAYKPDVNDLIKIKNRTTRG